MSYEELRPLVVKLVEPDVDDDPVKEFDTQPTTSQPSKQRTSTLDQLIESLKAAPSPPADAARLRTRKRA